ncbi:MAG: tetratricopeptide repeat protein [Acidobacteriota bacterium]
MTDSTWVPGLVVLIAGLAAGLLLGWRLRRQRAAQSQVNDPDLELALSDLEERRNDLYRRLHSAEEDHLGQAEREALETAAARTLREIDRLRPQMSRSARKAGGAKASSHRKEPDRDASAPPQPRARPALAGFASGALLMAVIAVLIYWAFRDAQPKPDPMTGVGAMSTSDDPHGNEGPMSAEVMARVETLRGRIQADPNDWMAKKELALTLMSSGQFFEAFELSDEILGTFPEDPDALLVQGVVRLTMGQNDTAVNLLDRVLAQHPDHLQALLYRGLALYQAGEIERAVDSWEMGLEMAGGRHPDFEELLAMASAPAAQPQVAPPPAESVTPSEQALPSAGEGYPVQVVLAPGTAPQPGSTLFVFLRPEAGGPPVAARLHADRKRQHDGR